MRRDARSFLWDVREAADAIQEFVRDRGIADYTSDLMLRSAVERQLGIIGEALAQLARTDRNIAARIPELRRVVGFRNVLIHGYDRIDDAGVWRVIKGDLPLLRNTVAALLTELGEAT
jgi:uncharacterized protein with HEPN domain